MAGEEAAQNSRGRGRSCYLWPGTRGARRLPGGDGGLGREDPVGSFTNSPSPDVGPLEGFSTLLAGVARETGRGLLALAPPPRCSPQRPTRGMPGPTPTQANEQAESCIEGLGPGPEWPG